MHARKLSQTSEATLDLFRQGGGTIEGPPINTAKHGPYVLRLEPASGTDTFGRSGFLMHGDSKKSPGCAFEGCVIMPRPRTTVEQQGYGIGRSGGIQTQDLQQHKTA
jgi:hypothetical protein